MAAMMASLRYDAHWDKRTNERVGDRFCCNLISHLRLSINRERCEPHEPEFENLEPEIEDCESESDEIDGENDDGNEHNNEPNVENNIGESHETRDSITFVNNPVTIENPEVLTTPDASVLQDATSSSVL
ncbi:hypothetical protein L6452_09407 [Arctium lappa]|uniref:Uncharacterized protein n=1 Tax=Arctium lappa TaxID=4217 RepID=A0ACB9DKL6_ARCLA|nr:hypothetical protein L6452_09407 [Arctium lappa]